jgi:predicted Zn-ribbon and HTH transcriptional regulator
MQTIRHQMIELLNSGEMTAIELSQSLGIPEKEVYEHLPHISRSVNSRGKRLVIHPAVCLKCGYAFKERRRFTPPGRCPRCKESHLQRPTYKIR